MSWGIHDPEKKESKEIKMDAFLQPLVSPYADGNDAFCPRCERKLPNFEQPYARTKRKSPVTIDHLVGNRDLHCGSCGIPVSVKYKKKGPNKGHAYTESPRFKIGRFTIPFFKKTLELSWNYESKIRSDLEMPSKD